MLSGKFIKTNTKITQKGFVVHVYGGAPKKMGSLEEYFMQLAKQLSNEGFVSVFVFSRQIDGELEKAYIKLGAKIILIPNTEKRFDLSTILKFLKLFINLKPSIINFHFGRTCFNATIAAKLCFVKNIIWTKHSFYENGPFFQKVSIYKKLTSLIFLQGFLSRYVIAISEGIKNEMMLYYLPEKKIIRIYLGVNLDRFGKACVGGSFFQDLKIESNQRIVACISQARPEKGLEYLVRAVPLVAKKISNFKILIVGGGPTTNYLENISKELGVKANILFCGVRNDVENIIANSEFTVLPSLVEGLGLVLLESIAGGKPVVATNVGGIPEVITDGVEGILVSPKDVKALAKAMIELLSDKHRLGKMADACAKKRLQFDVRNGVQETLNLYKELF